MSHLLENWFYWLMLAGGIGFPVSLLVLYHVHILHRAHIKLFGIGVGIGLLWELPLHFLGPHYQSEPIYVSHMDWPLLPIMQPLVAAMWDGMFFISCILLVQFVLQEPHFTRFKWSEILLFVICGGVSALMVEIIATPIAWSYVPQVWNPALFYVSGHPVVALPILIWFPAVAVFYYITLRIMPDRITYST